MAKCAAQEKELSGLASQEAQPEPTQAASGAASPSNGYLTHEENKKEQVMKHMATYTDPAPEEDPQPRLQKTECCMTTIDLTEMTADEEDRWCTPDLQEKRKIRSTGDCKDDKGAKRISPSLSPTKSSCKENQEKEKHTEAVATVLSGHQCASSILDDPIPAGIATNNLQVRERPPLEQHRSQQRPDGEPGPSKQGAFIKCHVSAGTKKVSIRDKEKLKRKMNAFFGRSHSRTTSLIFDRTSYRDNRAVISEEARARRASVARDVSSHIIQRESSGSSSRVAPVVAPADRGQQSSNEQQRPPPASLAHWQNNCICYPGGIEIRQIGTGESHSYRLKCQKQYLGRHTRSTSQNEQDVGIFVSEWTANFQTKQDAYRGLLCRLSFLQELEIKLNLHNVQGTGIGTTKCFKDAAIRERFGQYLSTYEEIRKQVRIDLDEFFQMYNPGGKCFSQGKTLLSILYGNKSSSGNPQSSVKNNVNLVRSS